MRTLAWDIFCRVVDNFGDIGVCWRLAAELASRGHSVRLWVDDPSSLSWMAPEALRGTWKGVQVFPWNHSLEASLIQSLPASDVWIEAFGCDIAPEFIAACAHEGATAEAFSAQDPIWINLEYLSAETYVERCHALPSPISHGPGKGRIKYFFYPGFTTRTGGLIRENGLVEQQQNFSGSDRRAWLASLGVDWQNEQLISLFCYEPLGLQAWLRSLAQGMHETHLLVTAGRAAQAVVAAGINPCDKLHLHFLPPMSQLDYDRLLWCCDLNMVRGEDSLVRALWAGKPLVWQIYPQSDDAHHAKLEAFLDMLHAPASLRQFHRAWNGVIPLPQGAGHLQTLDAQILRQWQQTVADARLRLLAQDDLCTQLVDFVRKNR